MLKTVIAALALSAGAVVVSTAAPAFASTAARTLTIGPQITVTVSCPADEHAVDHDGRLGCVSDETYRAADDKHRHSDHKSRADRHAKPKPRPTAKPAAPVVNPPVAQAPWQEWPLQHEYGWQGGSYSGQSWHDGYDSGHSWHPWV